MMKFLKLQFLTVCALGLGLFSTQYVLAQGSISTIEAYRELRSKKLEAPRSLIHNSDGNPVIYFPINEKFTIENLLNKRTAGLLGSDVTTISYCTIASGFGNFTHNTKVGEILTEHGFDYGILNNSRNVMSDLLAMGTDPLHETVKFAREHNFEIFWSNRINDTHDAAHRPDKPYFLWTEFKEKNPQYLFGSIGERLPNGRWSSLDFDHQEVRDLCVEFYREVCENYDVDGVELDFFRHFELFKTVGQGGYASQTQLDKLTDMLRQIRTITEEVGMKRGNPILLLIRVPTSKEYLEKAGIDIERWIDEGLVDIIVGSGYFRLEYWEDFVKLKGDSNVKMYAGLSESRVRDEHPLLVRQQNAVFRARAAAAWAAGVDGIYSFNEYNTRVMYLSQIGDPAKLNRTNNLYFVTYRDYTASRYLANGDDYFKMPRLSPSPGNHKSLKSGSLKFTVELGHETNRSEVFVPVWVKGASEQDIKVSLNGKQANFLNATDDGLLIYRINQSAVRTGLNEITLDYTGNQQEDPMLLDAAIFFCRDASDVELRELIALCKPAR